MSKIETFEELFEAIKELYSDARIEKEFICDDDNEYKEILIKTDSFMITNYSYDTAYRLSIELEVFATSKDPQKIYNVIKAIKSCEDSDD
jgi:hypothetical protein